MDEKHFVRKIYHEKKILSEPYSSRKTFCPKRIYAENITVENIPSENYFIQTVFWTKNILSEPYFGRKIFYPNRIQAEKHFIRNVIMPKIYL